MQGMMPPGAMQEMTLNQAKLYTKLAKIQEVAKSVVKTGYNKNQNYSYATEADILNVLREELTKQKIFVSTSSEVVNVIKTHKYSKDGTILGDNLVTVVQTTHTFCDGETGAQHMVKGCGTGWDSTDKGAFKAITGAMKYFLGKNFLIESEDDPENDGGKRDTPPARQSFSKKAPTSGTVVATTKVEAAKPPVVEKVKEKVEAPVAEAVTAAPAKKSFGRKKFVQAPKAEANDEPEF